MGEDKAQDQILTKAQEKELIKKYRFERGQAAGVRGDPPDEATDDYLEGYAKGRHAFLERKRRNI